RLTFTPWCRIGAVTMKITSKTSITSTSGVTLICDSTSLLRSPLNAIDARPLLQEVTFRDVEEFERKIVHLCRQHADLTSERIVRHHRRNGGEQAGCGGDQRLGNAGSDRLDGRGLRCTQTQKRVHDAPHGPEQTDERRRAGRGGEKRQRALELGELL